ncbi:MAG: hypothetical protein ACE5G5_08605 [Candidatus Methylomirabilales bacterium]
MGRHYRSRAIAAGALIAIVVSLFITQVALARHAFVVWVDGLVQRVEPTYRELSILDYKTGSVT